MTEYGRLLIGSRDELFAAAIDLVEKQRSRSQGRVIDVALSGGATPKDWYRWCVTKGTVPEAMKRSTRYTVSDERCVPLHSEQSNFGQADRHFLVPLGVSAEQRQPWPVHLLPEEAADAYAKSRADAAGVSRAYDICFLGMGDDGHTASIFPGSPLLGAETKQRFAAVDVPGKGWRLTITPAGLEECGSIVLMVFGAGKAAMLRRVFGGVHDPARVPVQLMKKWRDRVIWLTDQAF